MIRHVREHQRKSDPAPVRRFFQGEFARHAAQHDRPDTKEKRAAWKASQMGLDPAKLVFIDETWAKTNMTRLRGRARRGQ